ncbi:MAG TPA: NADH-quinone oxidoreductase subunit J [Actinomycetota bacterium]|nr:NADH-quinone oxidoreductase subunit J [Actinomycetota bacterium]
MTLFIIFGALALGSAIAMLIQRNAVHAALLLVVNLVAIAVLFLAMGAEFLFAAQIIVYAGAIMVLFLFVIMLLGVEKSESLGEPRRFQRRQAVMGILAATPLVAGLFSVMVSPRLSSAPGDVPRDFGSPRALGEILFRNYLLPFEVTSLLLLVAAIGILMLAKRRSSD